MPELPDLLYISSRLRPALVGRTIASLEVHRPVVLRVSTPERPGDFLQGRRITSLDVHGPFLRIGMEGDADVVINLMLAGRLQHQTGGSKREPYVCLSFVLDDGSRLHVCDEQLMAKVYLVARSGFGVIPRYTSQGVPVLSPALTEDRFRELVRRHGRKQVRVFLNDQTILSAIGNAYADEILFEARIHPKTFVGRLTDDEVVRLHHAVGDILRWGLEEVERAAQPVHVKVRGHLRVRNRHGEPCPRCGTTIRREGVRGYDVFYCPACQPPTRRHFLDWRKAQGGSGPVEGTR